MCLRMLNRSVGTSKCSSLKFSLKYGCRTSAYPQAECISDWQRSFGS